MRFCLLPALLLATLVSFPATLQAAEDGIDEKLAARATLIIRGERTATKSGPLHPTDTVKIAKVLKQAKDAEIGETVAVARGEFSPPIPDKPCTIYLSKSKRGWMLVGVSHRSDKAK